MIEKIVHHKVDVCKNDEWPIEKIRSYDKIVLSPGPGIPDEAGLLKTVIKEFAQTKSILGICLGHQAIGEVFGARLKNLDQVFHGVSTRINILDTENYLFNNLDSNEYVGRYHSWVVDSNKLPDCLKITALDKWDNIMGIRHRDFDIQGLQFHPESVLTPKGEQFIKNWIEN